MGWWWSKILEDSTEIKVIKKVLEKPMIDISTYIDIGYCMSFAIKYDNATIKLEYNAIREKFYDDMSVSSKHIELISICSIMNTTMYYTALDLIIESTPKLKVLADDFQRRFTCTEDTKVYKKSTEIEDFLDS